MRLWSLHPKYLDSKGIVALWREALLAQAVLGGNTRGYLNHPQLYRFRQQDSPLQSIADYLEHVHIEAKNRGYAFDRKKIGQISNGTVIPVTSGQVEYEWKHLLSKLSIRHPSRYEQLRVIASPEPHPLFEILPGGIAAWEVVSSSLSDFAPTY